MIVDTLDNLEKYISLNPLLAEVVKFLKENDLNQLQDGKHLIHGDDLFVNVATAHAKTVDETVFETHKQMIDIQIPLDNEETYGYLPLENLPEAEYNAEKDITKYPGAVASSYITCQPGEFALFAPQDGHQPCLGTGDIHKAIFKIKA